MSQGQTPEELKALHDLVLATKPDLPHPPCALCDKELDEMTMTDEEHAAAVAAAVEAARAETSAALTAQLEAAQAELDTLRQAQAGSEVEAAVATATAELQATVADLTTQVEAAQAAAAAAEAERDTLAAAAEEAANLAAIAERKDERVTAVKDLAVFPEAFVDQKADEWAGLDDDAWAAKVEELTALKDTVGSSTAPPARRSALTATAGGGKKPTTTEGSASSRLIRRQRDLMNSGPAGN